MHLVVEHELAADVAEVAALLTDPGFLAQRARSVSEGDAEVDVTAGAGAPLTVTTRRGLPTDQIPHQLRRFVGERLEARQVEASQEPGADGSRSATVVLEIVGAAVRLTGTARLEPTAAGSRLRYEGDLHAGVPLLGPAVEQAAADAIRATLADEHRVTERWLTRPDRLQPGHDA
ncbi:DUF2505 domain-containing protein [Cellulomonas massiliensis]|uniref:DUF2505 domain-containing protein n=1 Tax=Cellulomonas massiliensis TaxID=1465811 RepID=UPI0002E512DE|nr:DUF2505 domain-containing protein [Cellulomonas massiliensis]